MRWSEPKTRRRLTFRPVTSAAASEPIDPEPIEARPPRWVLPVALVPIITMLIAGYIAGASWPALLENHPLLLIALSPINRFLLLATQSVRWPAYFSVGLIRHLIPDPFFYMLGWFYGDKALAWAVETYPSVHRVVGADGKGLEDPAHRKILYPLAFFAPNNWVSLLSGVARIRLRVFIVLNVTGTIARLALCWWLGKVFSHQVKAVAKFVSDYQWPATIISVIVVLLTIAFQFRRGSGQLVGLAKLSEELDEDVPS